jgi:hypothetical protein
MTGVSAPAGAKEIFLLGHGVRISGEVQLDRIAALVPEFPRYQPDPDSEYDFLTCASLIYMDRLADSAIRISHKRSSKELLQLAWNHLWTFRLISLACRSPYFQLFSASSSKGRTRYTIANRYLIFPEIREIHELTAQEAEWVGSNFGGFWEVMENPAFQNSVRYLANSYFIRDPEAQLMLTWAGIERLIGTEAELRHRVAVYATILSSLSEQEGYELFKKVKSAYDFRSRVVHGRVSDGEKIRNGLSDAQRILYNLLRRCVELGRVPPLSELERISMSGRVFPI